MKECVDLTVEEKQILAEIENQMDAAWAKAFETVNNPDSEYSKWVNSKCERCDEN